MYLVGAWLLQSGIGCYGFGCRQIAGYRVLVYGIDHHLKQVVLASGIELKRLVDGAVFLLDLLIVSQHVEREFALLGIGFLELETYCSKAGRILALFQSELVIVAVASVLENF